MHTCIHAYMHTYIYTCMHANIRVYMYVVRRWSLDLLYNTSPNPPTEFTAAWPLLGMSFFRPPMLFFRPLVIFSTPQCYFLTPNVIFSTPNVIFSTPNVAFSTPSYLFDPQCYFVDPQYGQIGIYVYTYKRYMGPAALREVCKYLGI